MSNKRKPVKQEEIIEKITPVEDVKSEQEEIIEENSDGIIDSLFSQQDDDVREDVVEETTKIEHSVDPEDYALYKKYLG